MQSLTTATIKFPVAKIFDGQYGPSCNVLVTMPDGSELKIWGKPDELQSYRRGDSIALLQDAKGKFKPVAIAQTPQPAQHPAPQATAPKPELDKVAIADYATQQAKLYSYCYQQARSVMSPDAPDAAIQAAASSVYIATSRKFNL
ncbi:MAG: hypothetical protein ACAF42_00050 (plasmid) [Limnothrix sp. BL-A-16]|jgi:hypothetical protein